MGTRDLTQQEFEAWKAAHHDAAIALDDREAKLGKISHKMSLITIFSNTYFVVQKKFQEKISTTFNIGLYWKTILKFQAILCSLKIIDQF